MGRKGGCSQAAVVAMPKEYIGQRLTYFIYFLTVD